MRCSASFLVLTLAVATSTNAQNQNFAAQNQNFGQQSQHFGTTHFPIYSQFYEENDLSAEQFFYFDIDLLKEIAHDQREGNILISPLSIKSVLAMILEGAANESANELRMALHLPNNKRVRQQFQKLLTEFENPKGGVNLKMANRVFISKNLSPLDKYRDIITQYYYSNVTKLDFSNPTLSANTINSWVSEHTRGIIPTLVDEGSFGGDVSILLANALYFKGMWEKAFSELGTKTNCFYLSNGECQMTPMMDVVNNFKYDEVKKLDAKVLELTYSGGEYSMVIVLPNNKYGIQQLTRDIRTSINSIVQNLNETEVFVTLPRFKIDYSTDLVNYFPKVHITNIIGPKAMLPGIVADVGVRVSNALHKTYIEVNEQGTVAAAATGAVVIPLMGTTKPRFKADHPFLFFIRHTATGTILFEGRLSVPERSYVQPNQQQNPQQNNQQNPQQNNQQNQQHRPPQGNVQRPVNQQPTFLSTTQNNYNQNIQPQSQPQPQPQNQNGFATQQSFQTQRPAFQSSSQQQPSFQGQQVSFQSQTPPNYQGQQTQFQNPAQTAYQQTYLQQQQQQQQHILQPESIFEETRGHILKHIPQLNIPSNRQGQVQPNEANVNDLRNNEKSKPLYSESESLPIVYEDEINSKRLQ